MNDLFSLSTDITINFSQEQICKILMEAIEKQGYDVIGDIDFKLRQKCSGYGPGETYRTVFEGATAKVMPNDKAYNPQRS